MTWLGPFLAAAGLLVVAGAAKLREPGDLGRAAPLGAAGVRALAGVELLVGLAAVARPGPVTAGAVAVSYAGFAGYVVWLRRRGGPLATCGCFGAVDTAPTRSHVAVDVAFAAAAAGVATSGSTGWLPDLLDGHPGAGVPLLLVAGAIALLAYGVMGPLARVEGARRLYEATA